MENVYIKEAIESGERRIIAYTTLKRLLKDIGRENMYLSARNVLLKGKPLILPDIIIRKVQLKHYRQKNGRRKN